MVESRGHSNFKSSVSQVAVSLLANWGMVNSGMVLGFPSAVVPPLLGSGPGLHTSVEQASWVAGVALVSAPVACLVAGPMVDRVGRRLGLQLLNLTFASGWLLLAVFPGRLAALYLGRLLGGLGLGLATCVTVTYTSEIVNAALRTTLVTLTPVMMAIGTFLVYLWALFYQESWTEVSYFGFGVTMLSVLATPLLPESPLWLLNRGRAEEALQALLRLRGASAADEVAEEWVGLDNRAKQHQAEAYSWISILHNLRRPEAYKPLLIMNVFFIFQQMAGVSIVIMFAVDFIRAAGVEAEAYLIALGVAGVRTVSACLTSWACSRFGRRPPALFSGLVMSASVTALAMSPLIALSPAPTALLILLYVLSSSVGLSALPWSMLGEVFPTDIRGVASGMTACFVYFESFVGIKMYPGLVLSLGTLPVFLFFGISGLIGTVFIYLFLPETHGKSLIEIEENFKVGGWISSRSRCTEMIAET